MGALCAWRMPCSLHVKDKFAVVPSEQLCYKWSPVANHNNKKKF
jgi:hypothetical protein